VPVWDMDDPLAPYPKGAAARNETKLALASLRDYALVGEDRPPLRQWWQDVYAPSREARGLRVTALGNMYNWSSLFEWTVRLARFDELERARELREFRARGKKSRQLRIETLEGYLGQVINAMAALDPSSASFSDVTSALHTIVEQLRKEYGQNEQQVAVTVQTKADPVESLSDAELEAALANIASAMRAATG